ncbi:MAG: hypothetical protein HOI35_10095 [Woeseia sp.]|jgi:hypothetical protein|nr:hypothetical protein [Woeseia sp.]MBT6210359.1 hypothetical protein [Woeseia sp.]
MHRADATEPFGREEDGPWDGRFEAMLTFPPGKQSIEIKVLSEFDHPGSGVLSDWIVDVGQYAGNEISYFIIASGLALKEKWIASSATPPRKDGVGVDPSGECPFRDGVWTDCSGAPRFRNGAKVCGGLSTPR